MQAMYVSSASQQSLKQSVTLNEAKRINRNEQPQHNDIFRFQNSCVSEPWVQTHLKDCIQHRCANDKRSGKALEPRRASTNAAPMAHRNTMAQF